MRFCVMFIDDTALSEGLAASTSASKVSCRSDTKMDLSDPAAFTEMLGDLG